MKGGLDGGGWGRNGAPSIWQRELRGLLLRVLLRRALRSQRPPTVRMPGAALLSRTLFLMGHLRRFAHERKFWIAAARHFDFREVYAAPQVPGAKRRVRVFSFRRKSRTSSSARP